MKKRRIQLLLLTFLPAAIVLALIIPAGRANRDETHRPAPHITLAVDTTAGMADEVSALTAAWDTVFEPPSYNLSVQQPVTHIREPLTATFKLIGFRDTATYWGATADSAEMTTWLSSLPTGGDGTCRDNVFGALGRAAHLGLRLPITSTATLLVGDSAPWGTRATLARTINLLTRANVSVNSAFSGWCVGAPLAPQALVHLAAGTGGLPPLSLLDSPTLTLQILLSDMTTPQIVAHHIGGGASFSDSHSLPVDGSMDLLDITVISLDDPCANPLFPCPASFAPSETADVTVQVRDPHGNPVTAGAGVNVLEHEGIYYVRIDRAAFPGPMTGSFTVEIEGLQSGYFMSASTRSALHTSLLSPHTLPAGRTSGVVVALLLPAVQFQMPTPTEELFGAYNFHSGEFVPLDLKDDGLSGDRLAGDGIYGGAWQPEPGTWQIRAYGELADGSAFQRVVAAPVRVQPFRMQSPDGGQVMPGDNVQLSFSLTNDDDAPRTFHLDLTSDLGWAISNTVPATLTLSAGETRQIVVGVQVPAAANRGEIEETTLTALREDGDPLQSVSATVTSFVPYDTYLPAIISRADD